MAKVRIYELVKELGETPKDLLTKLSELNVDAASPLASIDSEDADRLRKYVKTGELIKRETPVPAAPKTSYEPIVQRPSIVVRFESDKSKPSDKPKRAAARKTSASKQAAGDAPGTAGKPKPPKPIKAELIPKEQTAPAEDPVSDTQKTPVAAINTAAPETPASPPEKPAAAPAHTPAPDTPPVQTAAKPPETAAAVQDEPEVRQPAASANTAEPRAERTPDNKPAAETVRSEQQTAAPPQAEQKPQKSEGEPAKDSRAGDRRPPGTHERSVGERPQRPHRSPSSAMPAGSSLRNRDTADGDRPARDDRRAPGQGRPTDSQRGDRLQRPQREGDRPARDDRRAPGQGRPTDSQRGDRPQRPQREGDRPVRDDRRPSGAHGRPGGQTGDRPGQRRDGAASGGGRSPRPADGGRGDRPRTPGAPGTGRRDRISDMMQRADKPADTKSRGEKPQEIRPRKKDGERQRPHKETDAPKRRKGIGIPGADDSEARAKRRRADRNRQKKPLMTATAAKKLRKLLAAQEEAASTEIKVLHIPKNIVISEFAQMMRVPPAEIVKELFVKRGMPVNQNADISFEIASEIAIERGYLTEEVLDYDPLEKFFEEDEEAEKDEDKEPRPPVVVVMGHVDHGKTSLLDAIRDTNVMGGEAGGITQHIGAYTVEINDRLITFLDTPGHEAFTAMRMRGAQVTDIAVLVVAADDGVMPQTIEAINHAKAAGVEIIVAINKIDKPGANPDRVKQELTEHEILVEDWGGTTIAVPVSAKNREGLPALLEMIILAADMKDLRANPNKSARGTVIEAALDKGRGPVATILVKDGTINVGDPIVAGGVYGKIRAMTDDKGVKVKSAGPSMPVEILGLSGAPQAGDSFFVAKNEREARQLSETVVAKGRQEMLRDTVQKVSLDALFDQIQQGAVKELNIVVKADVQGSVEAVKQSLEKLTNDEVRIRIIHGGVGAVTESDVMLASASNAIIIGFNVRPDAQAVAVAEAEKVDLRLYRIIYNAIEDVEAAMKGLLDPVFEEKVIGQAEIRQLFKASGVGTIGGSYVTTGKIARSAKIRIIRDGTVVYEGELDALRRFKDDVREVLAGYECGLTFNKFNDIKEGDIVEAFVMEEIPR